MPPGCDPMEPFRTDFITSLREPIKVLKCCIVGDGSVGKTCLLHTYAANKFPSSYVPTLFDNYSVNIRNREESFILSLFDTAGQEGYDRLRLQAYPGTEIFIVCYSVASPTSLDNVVDSWLPEINRNCIKPIILLVGTKTDLRDDEHTIKKLAKKGLSPVSYEQGKRFAKKHKLHGYVECSALHQEGIKNVFEEAIINVSKQRQSKTKPKPKQKLMEMLLCGCSSSR